MITLNLRIDWSELDLFGHVNNVQILKYIQAARVACWQHMKLDTLYETEKKAPLLVSVNCDFKKPLYFPGNIRVESKPDILGNTSFGFFHQIFDDHGTLAAEARDVMVFFDFNSNNKLSLPEEFRIFWN